MDVPIAGEKLSRVTLNEGWGGGRRGQGFGKGEIGRFLGRVGMRATPGPAFKSWVQRLGVARVVLVKWHPTEETLLS